MELEIEEIKKSRVTETTYYKCGCISEKFLQEPKCESMMKFCDEHYKERVNEVIVFSL